MVRYDAGVEPGCPLLHLEMRVPEEDRQGEGSFPWGAAIL
jgi:hypothetical protein